MMDLLILLDLADPGPPIDGSCLQTFLLLIFWNQLFPTLEKRWLKIKQLLQYTLCFFSFKKS